MRKILVVAYSFFTVVICDPYRNINYSDSADSTAYYYDDYYTPIEIEITEGEGYKRESPTGYSLSKEVRDMINQLSVYR